MLEQDLRDLPHGSVDVYYAGSWPRSDLEAKRRILAQQGVLDRLSETCQRETPFSVIYDRPTGGTKSLP
jgi:hypothetical protein